MSEGNVRSDVQDGVGTIHFFHPKGNSLPGNLLRELASQFDAMAANDQVRVVLLTSEGDRTFCGGASFDELLAVSNFEQGKEFFMGFARVILAMKRCPKFVIARVQGKAVGGGVGVISASDHAFAVDRASAKLSELALGIGPFVVGPAVEKRVGTAAFRAMSLDADWRSAEWAHRYGLYASLYESIDTLDAAIGKLVSRLAGFSPDAMAELKRVFWAGTDHWDQLLEQRAEISGRLILSDHAHKTIAAVKAGAK